MRPAPARAGSTYTCTVSDADGDCFNEAGPREGRKPVRVVQVLHVRSPLQ